MKNSCLLVNVLIALCLVFAPLGCKDNSSIDTPGPPGDLFPYALGNSWTYIDSTFSQSSVSVDTITVSVISSRGFNGFTAWTLDRAYNPSMTSREFYVSGDSVYSIQQTETATGIIDYPSLEYIRPLGPDSTQFSSLIGGDVLLHKSVSLYPTVYAGSTGSFSSFLKYWYTIYPLKFTEILAPSIGVYSVKTTNIATDSLNQLVPSRSLTLLRYALN